jgi:hypothetical protein
VSVLEFGENRSKEGWEEGCGAEIHEEGPSRLKMCRDIPLPRGRKVMEIKVGKSSEGTRIGRLWTNFQVTSPFGEASIMLALTTAPI